IVSPASARATRAANWDLACATDTVVPNRSSVRFDHRWSMLNRNNALSNRGVIFARTPGANSSRPHIGPRRTRPAGGEVYAGDHLFLLFYQVEIRCRQPLQQQSCTRSGCPRLHRYRVIMAIVGL